MRGIWLKNLARWATGTAAGSKQCVDVNVANTVAVPVVPTLYSYKERRVHLPATTNIPGSGSSMIELDLLSGTTGGTALGNTISEIGINWNGDGILEFGVGANAAAAAAAIIATVGAGQTRSFGATLVATNKVWVRHVKATAISSGELVVVFTG